MATIDGRPAQYGVTLRQLRELMESRGIEGVERIQREFGSTLEITKKLYSSPTNGMTRPSIKTLAHSSDHFPILPTCTYLSPFPFPFL